MTPSSPWPGQVKIFFQPIVGGSMEEMNLAFQESKAGLVAWILSDDRSVDVKFGSADLAALFWPLPS